MCKELGINLLQYETPNIPQRIFAKGLRMFGDYSYLGRIRQDSILSKLSINDTCLNIGGDTYCYGKPYSSMALNKLAKAKGAQTILWCCSIEDNAIDKDVKKDLERYDYIFARDPITVENITKKGINQRRIIHVCDPAFFLEKKEVELPSIFQKGNVIGLNVSECVIRGDDKTVYNAVLDFADYIIKNTDLNICLIPHVYSIKNNTCDWPIINSLKQNLNPDRVGMVDRELNCEELKYIISHCRFVIAARTHASIAAYSTGVPTLVIGYSVKSKGIATDLFGSYDNYVIPYDEIHSKEDLIIPFNFIVENEAKIRQRLIAYLPTYKKTLTDAIDKYCRPKIDYSTICDKQLCSGCMACWTVCPKNAITLCTDTKGFKYPEIDLGKCIKCNKCRNVCPSLNKVLDKLVEPRCFGFINLNEEERKSSSSGGAFVKIAEEFISNGGVVYGVGFNQSYDAEFVRATNFDELRIIQKSKYVQANVGDVYNQVKADLEKGFQVLFSGCPCHVVALKRILGKDYDNLLTIDIVCHGVPSPKAWQEYRLYVEKKHNSKICGVSFREKEKGWINFSVLLLLLLNGEKEANLLSEDMYFRGFISHFYLRNSCYNCSTRTMHRVSDLSLADFWGIEQIDPTMFDDKGTSLIMTHTSKGNEVVGRIQQGSYCKEYNFKDAVAQNPGYLISAKPNVFLHQFDDAWKRKGLIKALNHFINLPKNKLIYAVRSLKTWSK